MSNYRGDYLAGEPVDFKFTTVDANGAPATLGGGGLMVYGANSTVATATGLTLSAGFDGIVGLNHVRITTTSDTAFYIAQQDYDVIITTGTVTGTSVVGYTVAGFSIQNRYYSGLVHRGTLAGAATATCTLASTAAFASNELNDAVLGIVFGTGKGQARTITAQATTVVTLSPSFTTTPTSAVAEVWAAPPATTTMENRLSELDAATSGKAAFVIDTIASDADNIQTRLPAALSSGGMMKASVEEVAAATVTTTSALFGVNVVNISGSAVSTATAHIGVNLVKTAGTTLSALASVGYVPVDVLYWGNVAVGNQGSLPNVNVGSWAGGTCTLPAVTGVPVVDLGYVNGVAAVTGTAQLGVKVVSMATGAVTSTVFATGALTANAVATGALTSTAIATGALTASAVATGMLTTAAFATGAVTVSALATGVLTSTTFASGALDAAALATDAVAEISAAVWDLTRSGHATAGTFGEGIPSVQGNVTGSVGSVTGAVGSVTGSVGGNVTGSVGSLATQAKADVNTEVLDVIAVDTFAEPASVPAATSTIKDKLNWLFVKARNKLTQTSSTQVVRNDADSGAIGTATTTDDGTTGTRGEFA